MTKSKKQQKDVHTEKKDYMYSYRAIRKYHDSILHSAEIQKVLLPETYYLEMKIYLENCKEEYQGAKKSS